MLLCSLRCTADQSLSYDFAATPSSPPFSRPPPGSLSLVGASILLVGSAARRSGRAPTTGRPYEAVRHEVDITLANGKTLELALNSLQRRAHLMRVLCAAVDGVGVGIGHGAPCDTPGGASCTSRIDGSLSPDDRRADGGVGTASVAVVPAPNRLTPQLLALEESLRSMKFAQEAVLRNAVALGLDGMSV